MLTEKITEKEIEFMESWYDPICLAECLFSNMDDFGEFDSEKFTHIRNYQLPMLSYESIFDFDAYENLNKSQKFQLRKNIAEIYNVGARNFGKTQISLRLDIVLSALYEPGLLSALWSVDEKRIRGVLDNVRQAFEYHPIFRMWKFVCKFKPEIKFYGKKNSWKLSGVNIALNSKNPGQNWYQLHVKKIWGEEVSFETEEVFKKRRDSCSELGVINRQAGMTNFVRHSPAGKTFYNPKNKNKILNLPRYVNPNFTKNDLQDAINEFGGKEAPNYKIFVEGKIIEDGVSEFEMDRIKDCFLTKKSIKRFELKKSQFKNFESLIVVERPKNADRIFINVDIGESAGSDITIFSEIEDKYNYLYNIIVYSFTRKEQLSLFKWLIEKLKANVIALDCGEAMGRNLAEDLEDLYSKENVVKYAGASKVKVGYEKDEKNKILLKDGKPVCRFEYMSEWSVSRLKVLLYEHRIRIPMDYKFKDQINSVISITSGTRKTYDCISSTGDHLFDSFKVFSIAQWLKKDFNDTPIMSQEYSSGANSWKK